MSKLKPIKVPEIRFKYGWLLTDAFYNYRKMIPKFKKEKPPTWKKMRVLIKDQKKVWKKDEKKIIKAMQKIIGLNFYQNLIDVYIVDGHKSAFSDPMVINYRYHGEGFVDVLTHELLHRLLTDNMQGKNGGSWPHKIYPKIKNRTTIYHILVHAIHQEVYLNVLKRPDRLKHDIEKCKQWPSYHRAWNIVERDGHMNIINQFKKSKK
ncbi:MAG: hypothetical protein A3G05_01400 [Candidatus Zambryskibacteria bacterium RIFCSPLOWO2_12_FULL_45_14]|uniref:Uncharacterized protein n=2 Tax=Candidatus Zambryskiibacteriota TaxID=1817925 RepID=A0A1G2UKM6_9BACT|nr:MAG: hypothetical protein A3H60_00135 [Candidatus Zambryskibacteria bacterium RIFCSPLOWO2_02_FULL_44_12b]OHB13837.1 MAG: hypothetical protein A3G05_01400 [Candidatus Zambryskibacteria bacterium RIFCSPLOWO2_12_FULL_45_14]